MNVNFYKLRMSAVVLNDLPISRSSDSTLKLVRKTSDGYFDQAFFFVAGSLLIL